MDEQRGTNRDIYRTVLRQSRGKNIILIDGPRGCGKRTVAGVLFPDLPRLDLSDLRLRSLATYSPQALVAAFPHGAVVCDSQAVPSFFNHVCMKGMSSGQGPQSACFVFLWNGRENSELFDRTGVAVFHMNWPAMHETDEQFRGIGYGDITQNQIWERSCDEIIEDILQKDVLVNIRHCNEGLFRTFITECAKSGCQGLSLNSLADVCNISVPTASTWVDLLEKSGLLFSVYPSEFSYGQKTVSKKMICFSDTRLLCFLLSIKDESSLVLSPYFDNVLRTLILTEIRKTRQNLGLETGLSYFRTYGGLEIHVLLRGKCTWALRIAGACEPQSTMLSNLKRYASLCGKTVKTGIVHSGFSSYFSEGVNHISWNDIKNLASGLNIYS